MAIYNFNVRLSNHGAPEAISVDTEEDYSVAERFALEAVGLLLEGGWPGAVEPGFTPQVTLVGFHIVAASPTPPA